MTSPFAVLGVAEGSDVDVCAAALQAALGELAPRLAAALAEDRRADVERWAELVAAWRAVTGGPA